MRKRMQLLATLAAMAFVGLLVWKADAAASASAARMHASAENFSPIQNATCYGFGGWWCRPGWHRICRPWGCRCVPC